MSENIEKPEITEKTEITKKEYLEKALDLAMAGFLECEIVKILSIYKVKD